MEEDISDDTAKVSFLSGICPDPNCQTRLYYLSSYSSIECTGCGQQHHPQTLQNVKEEKGDAYSTALFTIKSIIAGFKPEPGTDHIKVHGLSNYKCKLLSHLLCHYGMDKTSGHARLLTEMGQLPNFDCGVLCDRAFCIDPEHLDIAGYGRDKSGSAEYLRDTLNVVLELNGNEERLIPIHADGDGHCLVHAVSRALVGRELFYYPLRLNLMHHIQENLEKYKDLFKNFVDVDEWEDIINECDPNFVPQEGECVGLRNIHIFGLANVLKRPIILLDNPKGIESSGDYSGVFLPALLSPDQCKNKNGVLNWPLCIAWSNQGRNHFIPLVGVKGRPCPVLPRYMLQTTWGVDPILLDAYITFDKGCCTIGGPRMLQDSYIQRLVSAMEEVFHEKYSVHPELVANVHRYIFRSKGFVGASLDMVRETTHGLLKNQALLICVRCGCLTALSIETHMLKKGGQLYELAHKEIGTLKGNKLYTFNEYQLVCRYNPEEDVLIPDIMQSICHFCKSERNLRYMRADGGVEYLEQDVTLVPAGPNSRCTCGFKHFYSGNFYDNRPRELQVPLEWGGKKVVEVVNWWENESDPQLNSNVYQVAQELIQKHFPGEFGIEILEQKIVEAILNLTAMKEDKETSKTCNGTDRPKWNAEEASKIILSGYQRKGIHKEELTKSESERQIRKQIAANAPQQQSRKSGDALTKSVSTPSIKRSSTSNSPVRSSSSPKEKTASDKPLAPGTPTFTQKPESSSSNSPKSDSPPAVQRPASNDKKVRIVTAGGRSETVTLTEDLTYSKLQQVIYEAIQVPPQVQKLRLGFPPKILLPPECEEDDNVVLLNHGDKIIVENTSLEEGTSKSLHRSPQSSFDSVMPSEETILTALASRQSGGDVIDSTALSLGLLAARMGADIWDLVQKQPHYFSVGGMYYRQAQKDVGLEANKHVTFPTLPGKCFAYNAAFDRLELCLGDLGHFEVEPDVERKAQQKTQHQHLGQGHQSAHRSLSSKSDAGSEKSDLPSKSTFGSSGAVTKSHSSQRVFEGQGHTLRGSSVETKMPQSVPLTENIRDAARRLQTICDPKHDSDSIDEVPEGMEIEENKAAIGSGATADGEREGFSQLKYTRKGPGYSVLEPLPLPVLTKEELQEKENKTGSTGLTNSLEEQRTVVHDGVEKDDAQTQAVENEVKTAEQIKTDLKAEHMDTT